MRISSIDRKQFKDITKILGKSFLFAEMSESEIERVLTCSGATIKTIDKNDIIFDQHDIPKYLFVLINMARCTGFIKMIFSKGFTFFVTFKPYRFMTPLFF